MNKKVLTLCAGFLLAGSLTATAQVCPQNGEFPYRSREVKSAMLDETLQDVTKINQEYYYQLQVNPESLGFTKGTAEFDGEYVLTAERDYSTGKIYLTAQKSNNATLTHSLWKITVKDRTVNGRVYVFENKETGFELSFDHMNALQCDPTTGFVEFTNPVTGKKNANTDWKYGKDGLMDGCNYNWAWYTTDEQDVTFGYKKVYSYFHNGTDSVMALSAVRNSGELGKRVYTDDEDGRGGETAKIPVSKGLSENGLDGTPDNGFAIVAYKDSKAKAQDFLKRRDYLEIKPVVAGAKVLNADEINTMIDANGSFLSFPRHIADYKVWNDAVRKAKEVESTKFTVCKPGTNEPMTFASNPFDKKFKAIEATVEDLHRDAVTTILGHTFPADYAGYDVLLETVDPIWTEGNDKQYGYLYVSEYPYEGTVFQGAYNGLEVKVAPYAYLTDPGVQTSEKRIVKNYEEATDKLNDALQARYHWKVTYYATNDSVVFEPLNASRMTQPDATNKLKFEASYLNVNKPALYLNTVNKGTAYPDANGNTMYNKGFGVPVALYAMNFGMPSGDKAAFLTVGYASGKSVSGEAIDAGLNKWAAKEKTEKGNPAYVTNQTAADTYQSQMELVVRFAKSYANPYERATVKDGLYFINIKNVKPAVYQTEHRTEGAYVVMDMGGHTVYDVEEAGQQDFTHMPATQWVVEQDQCLDTTDDLNVNRYPTVVVRNREFGGVTEWGSSQIAFAGQLYKNKETGNLVTLNHREYSRDDFASSVKNHYNTKLNCADEFVFNKIEKPTKFGYFNEAEETLRNSVYKFQHMFDMSQNLFLGTDGKFVKLTKDGAEFELYRSEGWTPVRDYHYEYNYATGKKDKFVWDDTYHFEYTDSLEYGYTSERAGAEQLYKTFYKVKVKDENLIDNDHTFLAINNQYKYVIATENEILDSKNELRFAVVTLKENNHLGIEHGYSLVNAPQYTIVKAGATKDDLKDLEVKLGYDETTALYYLSFYYVDSKTGKPVEMVKLANHFKDEEKESVANWGKLAVESISLNAKIASLCETTTDAFALVPADRKLYRALDAAYVNNAKKVIDLTTVDYQGNESLYEDSGSDLAKANKLNYLAAENLGNQTKREGFYVDAVAKSSAYMPQYLLAVAADSVPAYKYCVDGIHGINPGCGHEVETPGYVEGRFLVNFNDSITNAIDKLTKRADAFRASNRVRLGFVEGIHRGDSLYILKNTTLASIKKADKTGKLYVDPMFFEKDNEGKKYDVVKLDGKHNNAAFSFREVGDGSFLIESNDIFGKAQIGSFGGAWIQIINNIPVLAQYSNVDGNHNTGDSTDSWKKYKDYVTFETVGAAINQSARFTMTAVDKDAHATANETIATSDVTVSATNGAVVVKGAAGKAVVVTNILGQTLANTVISSDNASISVPAGIVVVAVEGEEAVKVVVK